MHAFSAHVSLKYIERPRETIFYLTYISERDIGALASVVGVVGDRESARRAAHIYTYCKKR